MNSSGSSANNSEDKKLQDLITWRRSKTLEYLSKGYNQSEIADILKVSQPTTHRDVVWIRQQSKENIHSFIQKRLPEELEKAFTSYDLIIRNSWNTADNTKEDKVRLQALDLVNKTIASKMEIINNEDLSDYVLDLGKDKGKEEKTKEKDSQSPDYSSIDEDLEDTSGTEEEELEEENVNRE